MTTVPAPRSRSRSEVVDQPSEAELAARLRLTVMRLARRVRLRGQDEGGITASQLSALSSLECHGAPTLGELSAAERVKPPTMTRIVASLEELGLVTRTVDTADRRVARLELTTAGRRLIERSRHRKDAYLAARLAALSGEDRATLDRAAEVLDRLLEDPE